MRIGNRCIAVIAAVATLGLLSVGVRAARAEGGSGGLAPLSSVAMPTPTGGDIVDQAAAVRLGKAFFWDIQVGGDGQTACATCHFKGGADNRPALHPGPDKSFNTADDVHGSPGLVTAKFVSLNPDPTVAADNCTPQISPLFGLNPGVTTRNAPTTASGLAFFRLMFWDGRANDVFNGINPFGQTVNQTANGAPPLAGAALTAIDNSALASQAVGPANKNPEVACTGRTFGNLGTKLLARPVLQHQYVHQNDSALGGNSAWPAKGLRCGSDGHPCSYGELISDAFGPTMAGSAVAHFSRIWGQAIQAYESTLIPDQTPFDRFLAGDSHALTDSQKKGFSIFNGKGHCTKCHAGAELTDASMSFAARNGLINEDGGDQGFHNIGVRPTIEDLGRGTLGNRVPFSVSGSVMDNGAFKTPALRNVKLTAPYFHNGGKATLADVVDFYARGGDFDNTEKASRITGFSASASDKAALVDFLRNALTDCRTEYDEAPFDHPSLTIINGGPDLPATGGNDSCQ